MKNQACRYGRWLGVLTALAVAVSIFACSGESSTMETPTSDPTPSVPPAPTPTPTSIPTPTAPSVPVSAVQIDDDTIWQELFDDFTPTEQACIRTEVGSELDPLLGERVMTDDDLADWQVSIFDCLTPESARSVYASVLVAGMVADETYDVSEQEIQCVSAWVASADVHRVIRAMADDDEVVFGEMVSGIIPCLPDLFLSEFLVEMDIDPDSLTDDERTCLNEWVVGNDWSNIMTAILEGDLGLMGELFPGLISCAPEQFLVVIFEDTGLDLDPLTDEERECLKDWLIDLDWDALMAAISATAFVEEDEAYGILAEVFGLLACVPDLPLYENVGSGGPDDDGDGITDATHIGVGESIEGAIDYEYDLDLFELTVDAGQVYQIDVSLGTLEDSVLAIYDADGWEVAYNDDYGEGLASRIVWEPDVTGVYYVEVSGLFSTGSYTLSIMGQ